MLYSTIGRTVSALAIFMSAAGFGLQAFAQEGPVKVVSYPPDAEIVIFDLKDATYQRSCVTPCELNIDQTRYLGIYTGVEAMNKRVKGKPYWMPSFDPRPELFVNFADIRPPKQIDEDAALPARAVQTSTNGACPVRQTFSTSDYRPSANPAVAAVRPAGLTRKDVPRETAYCRVKFDLDEQNVATNLDIQFCTHPAQEGFTRKVLASRVYSDKTPAGAPASRCGIVEELRYDRMIARDGSEAQIYVKPQKDLLKSIKKNYKTYYATVRN